MYPIRCFTCGKLIGDKFEEYKRRVNAGESPKEILDSLKITRYCCRKMFIAYPNVDEEILYYHEVRRREAKKKTKKSES